MLLKLKERLARVFRRRVEEKVRTYPTVDFVTSRAYDPFLGMDAGSSIDRLIATRKPSEPTPDDHNFRTDGARSPSEPPEAPKEAPFKVHDLGSLRYVVDTETGKPVDLMTSLVFNMDNLGKMLSKPSDPQLLKFNHSVKMTLKKCDSAQVRIQRYPEMDHLDLIPAIDVDTFDKLVDRIRDVYWRGGDERFKWTLLIRRTHIATDIIRCAPRAASERPRAKRTCPYCGCVGTDRDCRNCGAPEEADGTT